MGVLALVTIFVLLLWFLLTGDRDTATIVVAILAIATALTSTVAVVNRVVTAALGPRALPRLDLDDGVPTELRTLVTVPMLLTSVDDVEQRVATLEIHYQGNREGDLRFALLCERLDADSEHTDNDDELLAVAAAAIDRLNERYGDTPGGGHALPALSIGAGCGTRVENRWIGWERGRGKLRRSSTRSCAGRRRPVS